MKYWLITTEFPPSYGGGIGTYCFQSARMLALNKWDVTVFVAGKNKLKDNIYFTDGIRVVEFAANRSDTWNYLGYETALAYEFGAVIKNYLEAEGLPDVLESQEYGGIAYFILQYKHLGYTFFKDLRVLLTLHAPSFLYNDYNRLPAYRLPYFWIGEMERWCIQAADMINAPSHFMIDAIQPYFNQSSLRHDIEVIPYPFDIDDNNFSNENEPRDNWFFFGKLTTQKGIKPLLNAYRNLLKNGWQQSLFLIGGGDHLDHIENTSASNWIKREYRKEIQEGKLVLLGNLSPEKWKQKVEKGAVIIIPSIGDNYPFTVLESMAKGQLVLASKQGGQRELIEDGYNGILFDHTTDGDLERQMSRISNFDLSAIQTIRLNAQQSVKQKHNFNEVFSHKARLVDKLLKKPLNTCTYPFIRNCQPAFSDSFNQRKDNLLSVVIPFYNLGKYLEKTLESVFQSDYKFLEVIVVDDGSDDELSVEVLRKLKLQYNFKLHSQENKGLSAARNIGARLASGSYLAFVDADDKVHPQYFSRAIEILKQKQNVFFIGAWVQYFEGSEGTWPSFNPEPPYILYYNTVCSGGLVYKKDAFLNKGLNDSVFEYGLEDWEHVINLVQNGYYGVVIPEKLYYYRVRKKSMARSITLNKNLYTIRKITNKHASFYQQYGVELNSLTLENGPGYKNDNPTLDKYNYGLLGNKYPALKKIFDFAKRNPFIKKIAFKVYQKIKK